MPALILYLLKVNVALALFYMAYHIALRRLTFYHLNRLFLVFGIVFSTVYPFIDLSGLFINEQQMAAAYMVTIPEWAYTTRTAAPAPEAFDYWQLPVYIFWAGVAVMLARFMLQLLSLYRIHAASEPASHKAVPFREVKSITQAFSFWQTIYLNPAQHRPEELESILRHELIHITGWHTLDVLLAELSVVFCWFNPGAWLMKKAMKENLEFIADQNVVSAGIDRKEYQYLLLKVVGAAQPQIANQFSFPSLKRRIVMMNKIPTRKASQLRLLIVLPLVSVLLFAFRNAVPATETIAGTEIKASQQNGDIALPEELVKQLKQNPSVKSVRGIKIDNRNALVLNLKGGGTEVYYIDDAKSIAELERKYNLPALPPPPPPAPDAPALPPPPPPVQEEVDIKANTPKSVIYYIDGIEASNEAVEKLAPEVIHSVNVIKGESATRSFGDRAGNGVISVTTKENQNAPQVLEFNKKLSALSPPQDQSKKQVRKYSPPIIKQDQKEELPYIPDKANQTEELKAFLKRNPEVKQVGWTQRNEGKNKERFIHLYLKSGESEVYNLYDKNNVAIAVRKYGELPALPPPPPPVRSDDK